MKVSTVLPLSFLVVLLCVECKPKQKPLLRTEKSATPNSCCDSTGLSEDLCESSWLVGAKIVEYNESECRQKLCSQAPGNCLTEIDYFKDETGMTCTGVSQLCQLSQKVGQLNKPLVGSWYLVNEENHSARALKAFELLGDGTLKNEVNLVCIADNLGQMSYGLLARAKTFAGMECRSFFWKSEKNKLVLRPKQSRHQGIQEIEIDLSPRGALIALLVKIRIQRQNVGLVGSKVETIKQSLTASR